MATKYVQTEMGTINYNLILTLEYYIRTYLEYMN